MTIRLSFVSLSLLGIAALPLASRAAEDGQKIYSERCAFCHGTSGKGDGPAGQALTPPPADFASASYWKSSDPQRMREVIENGKDGTAMVPFKQLMNSEQVDAVLKYLQTFRPAS